MSTQTEHRLVAVMVGPARLSIDYMIGGQAAAAHSLTPPPGGLIKIAFERRKPS